MMVHSLPPRPARTGRGVQRHPQDGWQMADPAPLSRRSERALRSVVRALVPPPPAPHPADIEARVEHQVRCMMQYMPTTLRLGFVCVIRLLAWSPLWRLRGAHHLDGLAQADASRVLAGIALSRLMPLRLMMLAPKAIVLSAYFDQDEVHAALDYEPRSFMAERNAARDQLLADSRTAAREPSKVRLEVVS
jgi:hypothetical protein